MHIYFFDTETTGNTSGDRLIQLAIKERGVATPVLNELFKPPMPIPFESSAVHHISNKMVANKPLFKESPHYAPTKALFEDAGTIAVAHNAQFDVSMLAAEGITSNRTICTFRVAHRLDVSNTFTNYKLQYLRYALDMELDVPAHDALADVLVLEQLFEYLLKKVMEDKGLDEEGALALMEEITKEPMLMKKFTFGKHNGKFVEEVAITDPGYLSWLLEQKKQNPDAEADWIFTLETYLKK